MKKNKRYYSMVKEGKTATLNIFGEITMYPFFENDVTLANLSKQLEALGDVSEIDVYINSPGGDVFEGVAIYNALKNHKAKVRTYCESLAASIASVIFMAGDERIMPEASMLMIHNAWGERVGNAKELRKYADDLDKITQLSVGVYSANSTLSEDEIQSMLDEEKWLFPDEALEYGFATAIDKSEKAGASQNAMMRLVEIVKAYRAQLENDEDGQEDNGEPENPADEPENPETGEPNTNTGEPEKDPEKAPQEPETGEGNPEDDPAGEPAGEPTGDDNSDDGKDPADNDGEENPEDENKQEEPAQKWSGFFNALIKL